MVTLTNPGTVTLSSASIKFGAFLGTPSTYGGYFLSNSGLLNRIWYAGAYTINLDQVLPGTPGFTSGTTIDTPNIVDGAKRDRDIWVGDLTVAGRTALDAFGKVAGPYVKGSLMSLGDYPEADAILFSSNAGDPNMPGPMPGSCPGETNASCSFYSATYSMDYVLALYDYYLYTGDQAFVAQEWPLVQRELAWENSQVDLTGLFSTTALDSADWDTNFTHPAGDYAADSIVHYESLLDGGALAKAVGDSSSAQMYLDDAATEKAAINSNLWDPSLGGYDASTAERGFLVQDANVWAVLYGVASPTQSQLILKHLASGLASPWGMLAFASTAPPDYTFTVISPYVGSFTVWADYQAGRPDLGLGLMQTEWGWMVNHDPQSTDWERIQVGGTLTSQDSAAHGWSSGASSALSQYVLGIQPVEPGFGTWRVQPEPYGLNWAQGTVPTPYGPVASRWQVGPNSSSFKLTAAAPSGTSGTVAVPQLGAPRVIAEDGRVVWNGSAPVAGVHASSDGTYVYFAGVSGTHTWAW
jgi:alpha-L-rhamnosidase